MGDHVFGSSVKGAVFLLTFSGAVVWLPGVRAEDAKPRAAFAMSIEEFRRLSPVDQKAIVKGAFERRLELARNIHYEALQTGQIHRYKDGRLGEPYFRLKGRRYRHWRLGDSWRIDSEKGGYDVSEPTDFGKCSFDASAGVRRSTLKYKEWPRLFGRIDVRPHVDLHENRYAYWLDGKTDARSQADYLIRDVIDWFDQCQLEAPVTPNLVRLTIPWRPIWSKKPIGTRQFDLDPAKGFLPIRGKAHCEMKRERARTMWRHEEFSVEDASLVGDVWMPIRLKEMIRASSGSPDQAAIWETRVNRIEAGKVTAKDLEVPFPEGTEVQDAIHGTFYVVGPGGRRIKERPLVGARRGRHTSLPRTMAGSRHQRTLWAVLLFNAAGAVAVCFILVARSRQRSSAGRIV